MDERPDLPEMLRRAGIATAEQADALRAEIQAVDLADAKPFADGAAELRAAQSR